ncbi:hypothetical protein CTAYLR_006329 [Chrysophaeum taylorii]|uniref:Uncharacterized protein n=1 Tax=Chrysophaeum taylorii TaxID=2483200 RepID=A0AAD7UC56_9STRA|nr:hypothetical protein CTAYLR_006329 [Chrysophaeum taylorii]
MLVLWFAGVQALSVGIDLGTSTTCVAYLRGDDAKDWALVPHESSSQNNKRPSLLESIVSVAEDGSITYGRQGVPMTAWKRAVGLEPQYVSWRLSPRERSALRLDSAGRMIVSIGGREHRISPSACSRVVLERALQGARAHLGEPVDRAVLGVPASYLPAQREAVAAVGRACGLDKVQVASEPELAAHAYGLGVADSQESLALVVDLGGGTLDVSFVAVGGPTRTMEVVATAGDPCLGGVDFTKTLADCLRAKGVAGDDLFDVAEAAKIRLTTRLETDVGNVTVSRRDFDEAAKPLLGRVAKCVREAAIFAGASLPGDALFPSTKGKRRKIPELGRGVRRFPRGSAPVDAVVLVGAATRMPSIQKTLSTLAGCPVKQEVDPEHAVAIGAAIRAAINDHKITDFVVFDAYQAEVLRHFARRERRQEEEEEEEEDDDDAMFASLAAQIAPGAQLVHEEEEEGR